MERPLTPLLCAFIAGITVGHLCRVADPPLVISLLLILILLLAASIKKSVKLIAILVVLSSALLGILDVNQYLYREPTAKHIINYVGREKLILEGVICENPESSPDRTELIVSASRLLGDNADTKVEGLILLNVEGRQEFKYGDAIRFRTRLKVPHNFQNPGGFDYAKYLRYKGVMVRGFIKDPAGIVILRENQGNIFKLYLEGFRAHSKKFIMENTSSPEGEIIQAMILGDEKEIPKDVMENFNKTGTTHIIAISGFNIGIIAFLSFAIIRLIMKSSTYLLLRFNIIKVSTVFAIGPVIIYTFIAGIGISVVRAAIMAVTFMIAIIFGKDRDLYNSLVLAALVILAVSPPSLFDVSFQLSFMAVWAILFITPRLALLLPHGNHEELPRYKVWATKIYKNVVIFVIVSLSATLGTLPLIVFYFNRVSTLVLLSNLFVVPILGILAIPVCTAIIVAAPLSHSLALVFLSISSFLVKVSISMVGFFASFPGSSFFLGTPTLLEISAYYLFLIVAVKLIDQWTKHDSNTAETRSFFGPQRLRVAAAALAVFFALDALHLYLKDRGNENLVVTAIDVGQGSSALLRLPGGKKILVDGGGIYDNSFDIGKYVVAPFLWYERIRHIDIVVLTHPHPDHLNGLIYVLSNFNVNEVWTNGEAAESDTYKDFMRIVNEKNITRRFMSEGVGDIRIHNVTISILNPRSTIELPNDLPRPFDKTNNDAIVMKITMGNVRVLLPADISETSEMRIIDAHKDIRSQIMFAPHHGGFTSSTAPFLNRVQPEIAVISCGRDNVYNDAHPDVLRRYFRRGTRVLRTDINGTINITTDGTNVAYNVFTDGL
ncbi:MAG: DNA internalization-related competence protein ComEC/Rec2 [Syntrophales bacterium]|jgi:competence protein ComEC